MARWTVNGTRSEPSHVVLLFIPKVRTTNTVEQHTTSRQGKQLLYGKRLTLNHNVWSNLTLWQKRDLSEENDVGRVWMWMKSAGWKLSNHINHEGEWRREELNEQWLDMWEETKGIWHRRKQKKGCEWRKNEVILGRASLMRRKKIIGINIRLKRAGGV